METPKRSDEMLKYVPGYYRGSKHYLAQNEAKGREFDILRAIMDDLPNQFFPQTATWGLKLWEEFLGITPKAGESLAVRRMNVMKKNSHIQKVTPISLERMIWFMATAKVDIIRNVALYTFKVQLREESLDADLAAIREVVEEYKEAHMAYLMAIFLGTIRTGERFVPRVINRMSIFWYTDWILDGKYSLDGEKRLDAVFPPFYRIVNRLMVQHKEYFRNATVNHALQFEISEYFSIGTENLFAFYWWGDNNRLLNGRHLLDGSYMLNTVFPPYNTWSTHVLELPIYEAVKGKTVNNRGIVINHPYAENRSVQRMIFYWWGDLIGILNGIYKLDGSLHLDTMLSAYRASISLRYRSMVRESYLVQMANYLGKVRGQESVSAQSQQRMMFCWWGDKEKILNGKYLLDGEEELDKEFAPYKCKTSHRATVQIEEAADACVTIKNNLWYLDGTYSLDGTNKLNAYELKEEL